MNNVKKSRIILWLIFALSVIGATASGYALFVKYGSGNSLCDISPSLSCSTVNQSAYSELFGIPVALLGLMAYLAFAGAVLLLLSEKRIKFWPRKLIVRDTFFVATVGLIFQLYLTYAEAFIIQVICALCVLSQIVLIVIWLLLLKLIMEK